MATEKFGLKDWAALAFGAVVFFAGSPVVMLVLDGFYHETFLPDNALSTALGALSSAVGIFFCLWANVELIKRGHGGAAVLGPVKLCRETSQLVVSGPYALCRNPMHLGIMLYQLGLCCAINSLIALLVPACMLVFAYLLAKFVDEPRLRRDFAAEYEKWAEQVPRFLPRVKY